MKNKKRRLKAMGATAIILAGSMAAEAGKVSMKLNGNPQGDFTVNRTSTETAKSLQQKKISIMNADRGTLGHLFASAGDYIRNGKTEDAVNAIDQTLRLLCGYPSLSGNETRDVDTQTTLSMLSESEISTQTEYECKEIGVQVSSSMALASTQTESVPTSTSFAQTDSSTIGASEIATQTHIVSSDQEVQTTPLKLSDSFSQTESNQEQIKQTEIGTSTDDLFELENSFNDKRIEEWDLESQSSLEANSWDLDSEVSMASSSLADTEAEQSDTSTKIGDGASLALTQQSLSETSTDLEATATSRIRGESSSITYASNLATNEEFSSEVSTKEVQEQNSEETDSIQKEKALHLKEELRQSEEAELRLRKQEEVTKVLEETSKAGATLASTSSGVTTNILNSISQRFNLNSMAVAAGDEGEQATLIEPHTGFYISPFVSKTNAKEFGSTSGFNGRSRGYTVGFDSRVNDLLLLGMSYTKADSHVNFKQNHLGDKALIDSNFYSLYGQLMPHHQKYFLSTIAIYGKSDISSKARRGSRGTALGRHKAYSNILEVLAGSSQRILQAFSVTEQLGLKYSRTKDAAYTERVAEGTPSLIVGRAKSKDFEAIAGLKIDYRYNLSRDITLIPEIYGFASKAINSKAPVIRTKLLVADDIVAVPDIRAMRSKLDLSYGASVGIRAKNVDISAGYHAVKARRLMSHAGSLKVKINL